MFWSSSSSSSSSDSDDEDISSRHHRRTLPTMILAALTAVLLVSSYNDEETSTDSDEESRSSTDIDDDDEDDEETATSDEQQQQAANKNTVSASPPPPPSRSISCAQPMSPEEQNGVHEATVDDTVLKRNEKLQKGESLKKSARQVQVQSSKYVPLEPNALSISKRKAEQVQEPPSIATESKNGAALQADGLAAKKRKG